MGSFTPVRVERDNVICITLDLQRIVLPEFQGAVDAIKDMDIFSMRREFRKLKRHFGSGDPMSDLEFQKEMTHRPAITYCREQAIWEKGKPCLLQNAYSVEEELSVNLASVFYFAEKKWRNEHRGAISSMLYSTGAVWLEKDPSEKVLLRELKDQICEQRRRMEEDFFKFKSIFEEFECEKSRGALTRKIMDVDGNLLEESRTNYHPVVDGYWEDFNGDNQVHASRFVIGYLTRKNFPGLTRELKDQAKKARDFFARISGRR